MAKKQRLPKPSAHKKENWYGMLTMAENAKDYVTNGHFLLKTDKVPKRGQKTIRHRDGEITLHSFQKLLNTPTKQAELKYYSFYDYETEGVSLDPIGISSRYYKPKVVFEAKWWENSCRSGAWLEMSEHAEFNQLYFNIVRNRYPNATYGLTEQDNRLV